MTGFHEAPNTFVGEVVITVADIDRSLAFYQEFIGFKVLKKSEKKATLTADGMTALLSIEQPEDVSPKGRRTTGLYHFAILLPDRRNLGSFIQHLIQNKHSIQGASDHLVSEALYMADPDGNGIEVYTDRPSSSWNWQGQEVEMTSEALDIQSILSESEGTEWNGLPSGTRMGHIHLHVAELAESANFYTKGLGFDIVNRYGGQALFLSSGKYHHHIGLNTWNGVGAPKPENNSVGLKHFTLVIPSEEMFEKIISQLKDVSAEILKNDEGIFTIDPSGNRIKLLVG
ncbi:catechol 2,3-dioxygenase [Bacillus tianshenii]|uniref:Catechol 2,3-dioxygenase n=1 Tax=Sutcliffiella tianshenii TaxID=1463404 RepID=A0ABS2P226_9BACI|nr:VOC family protein [Bacillus tianshenii]MBM7620934.1 catechol 2,3-dioxygenase [Bacillus tianshenii]